jgi:hypothetical protein
LNHTCNILIDLSEECGKPAVMWIDEEGCCPAHVQKTYYCAKHWDEYCDGKYGCVWSIRNGGFPCYSTKTVY